MARRVPEHVPPNLPQTLLVARRILEPLHSTGERVLWLKFAEKWRSEHLQENCGEWKRAPGCLLSRDQPQTLAWGGKNRAQNKYAQDAA